MAKRVVEYVTKTTPDVTTDQVARLREIFPECVAEGRVDFERLRATLGDLDALAGDETYSFTWAGRADAFRAVQTPSAASLRPAPDESVNWDTTQHLFIEGENLEVLKLLYKSYYGRVKMIYIDPPYNTGNDFIYRDDYSQPRRAYLEKTGQVDAEGNVLTSNPEASGRYHSDWLTMMYPRLFLARQLLREDGVIFVSIDDNEVHNLRLLLNEIFGEENFVAQLTWEKGRKNDAKLFSVGHEYLVVYARSRATLRELGTVWREPKPGAKEIWEQYCRLREVHGEDDVAVENNLREWYARLPKTHPSKALSRYKHVDRYGPWRDRDISWPGGGGPRYDVLHPVTGKPCKVPERGWGFATPEEMQRQISLGLVEFREDHTNPPFRKAHLYPVSDELLEDETAEFEEEEEELEVGLQVMPSVLYKQSQVAVKYLRKLMGAKVFDNPKDHEILGRLIRYCTNSDTGDIVLDFFAGAASTAEAVLELNHTEGGNRRFIMVQLPEPVDASKQTGKNAKKVGLETVSAVGKERIHRVIVGMQPPDDGQLTLDLDLQAEPEDLGFRVFKLAPSAFRQWDQPNEDVVTLVQQLTFFDRGLEEGADPQDVVYEVILKEGYPLTSLIETLPIETNRVYRITDTRQEENPHSFYLCLDAEVHPATLDALPLDRETVLICLDSALDDSQKVNLAKQCLLRVL